MPGRRIGSFEILSVLGAGGMGEVYRARDTKLGRDVALKTLPSAFTTDVERVARFQREAQVLAALNHPHIAAIHGIDEADGCHFLVLELADGETLASRLAGGPLPVDDALTIARQVALALEAAHETGIVHRDLKPANIALTAEGSVKVLDFGLAKVVDGVHAADQMMSPTITFGATQAGVILGTAAYMSPEQAKGRAADKRSDVWGFGCVLYEMLTGRRAFDGEDVTETIAAVVRDQPDWARLPSNVPAQVLLLLKRCLEKDRRARVSDIAVARFLLTESMPSTPIPAPYLPSRRRLLAMGALAAVIAAMVAGAAWLRARVASPPAVTPARFVLTPPSSQPLMLQGFDRDIAISPDGSNIVYRSFAGSGGGTIFAIRGINDLAPRVLGGTGGRYPFISPDGQWLGYAVANELRKISMSGGPPLTICKLSHPLRGVPWGTGGRSVFGGVDPRQGLQAVPARGGEPRALTTPDPERGEIGHYYPFVMPDGKSVLFTIGSGSAASDTGQLALLDLQTGRHKVLIRGAGAATFVEPEYLVYATAGTLRAARFDPRRLEVIGDPVPVVDSVRNPSRGANYSVSRNGTLVYVPAYAAEGQDMPARSLVWVDRRGGETPLKAPPRPYGTVRLSPDGTRVALDIRSPALDIWVWDIARETLTPLNLDSATDLVPLWTPDSRRIIWSSSRGGGNPNLYWQSADGSGAAERLTTNATAQFATSMASDGSRILLFSPSTNSGIGAFAAVDLFTLAMNARETPASPLLQSDAQKLAAEFSPDGRWIAYQSNESGQQQVYVRPFPNIEAGRWQISTDGGTRPAWARKGDELFYLDGNDQLTAVRVQATATTFVPGKPAKVLSTKYVAGTTTRGYDLRTYDVSPDGQRFLMLKGPAGGPSSTASPPMVVVVNWVEELKARVPAQ